MHEKRPLLLDEPSETEAKDFDVVTPEAYSEGVSGLFQAIEEDRPEPPKVRETPRAEPLDEFLRPSHLQELSPQAEAEIKRGISSLLFGRIAPESELEKKETPKKITVWGDIIG